MVLYSSAACCRHHIIIILHNNKGVNNMVSGQADIIISLEDQIFIQRTIARWHPNQLHCRIPRHVVNDRNFWFLQLLIKSLSSITWLWRSANPEHRWFSRRNTEICKRSWSFDNLCSPYKRNIGKRARCFQVSNQHCRHQGIIFHYINGIFETKSSPTFR